MISENELTPDQNYKMEQVLFGMKKNKRNFVKKYGMKAEALMKKRALKIAKQYTPEPTSEEMENDRLKKLVQDALSKPLNEKSSFTPKYDDKFNDKRKDLPDGLQKAILKKQGSLDEDLDLGHEDDEPHMLKADLYRIGKYAMELYKMVDQFEGEQEVDFPHWWQAKIIHAKSCLVAAKHYLDFELKEPQVDAMVGVAAQEDAINEYEDKTPKHKIVKQWVGPNSKFILATKPESEWDEKDYDLYDRILKMVKDEGKIPTNLEEKLKPSMGAGAYVDDFRTSKAPQFKGKSKKKKNKMAVAAYLSAKDKIKEAVLAKLQESKGEYAKIEKEISDLKSKGKTLKDPEMVKLIKRRAELEKSKK